MAGCCKLSLSDTRNGEKGRERRKESKTEGGGKFKTRDEKTKHRTLVRLDQQPVSAYTPFNFSLTVPLRNFKL